MTELKDTKKVQIQIYLLKESVAEPEEAFREVDDRVKMRPLRHPLEGLLLTKLSVPRKPDWASFLEGGVDDPLSELSIASASALLILRSRARLFAITYGYGKSLIEPSKIDRRFGLKVALNAVDPLHMRAVDSRTVEDMTIHTRRQTSRTSEISSFGLDTSRDLLRGVTGIPRDGLVGSRVSGSESVTLSAGITLADLPEKCAQLLEIYSGDEYKERFSWIDHLQLVTDPMTKKTLEQQLSSALALGQTDGMHLAPPEALDWQNVSGFYYWEPERSRRHDDLDIEQALEELREHASSPLSAAYLRGHHLWVEFRESQPVARFTIHSALVFETEVNDQLYVLSDGDWHEVDLDWANSIRREVAELGSTNLRLPDARPGEIEEDYNARAAIQLNALCMDRCIVRYGPAGDQVELCDILTPDRELVHVKRKTQSATLSHLFMQGQNSGLLLAYDSGFRAELQMAANRAGLAVEDLVPLGSISTAAYEIVFAIIAKPNVLWPHSLPFFSQLSLSGAATTLQRMGYRVSLKLVPLEAA